MQPKELKRRLDQIKDSVLNKVLIIVLFVQVIGVTISALRISQTGFKFIYGVHFFLVALVFLIYIFRHKLSPTLKGGLFMVALYTLAIAGLSSWGLYGFGYVYFIPATAIAFLYFNKKTGWILTMASLAVVLIISFLFKIGALYFSPENSDYMQSASMWLNMVITLCLVGVVITLFWNNIFTMLMKTFLQVNEHQEEIKKINEELIVAKNKAEQSDKLKSAFLANMSHEIRTPLNIIIGFSGMVAETESFEERMELNTTVRDNCNIMLKLVNDIVDFSKIESQSLSLNNTDFNIKDVMEEVEKELKKSVQDGVILNIEKKNLNTYNDKDRLHQVLLNLVHNATKFTSKGTIEVSYSENANNVRFKVIDSGIGISNEHHEKIFNRFFKVDQFSQGAGLGLCICKWVTKLMNGEIWVDSEIGKGATFEFVVPLKANNKKKEIPTETIQAVYSN